MEIIMKKSYLLSAVSACLFSLSITSTSQATVIDAYFGMNFVSATASGFEANLTSITYIGDGGGTFTTVMPAFPGDVFNNAGTPRTGLPDIDGLSGLPTYTNGGDGESTRTIGETVSIDWDTSGAFPTIQIISITADALDFTGSWSADMTSPYLVGLIPAGADSELNSSLAGPQEDIYDAVIIAAIATSAPPAFTPLPTGDPLFGTFTFSAASAVPIPAGIWLFGSGLLGLVGISRRKKAA
jgi:hypothetical protein